jgi:hypothetical protein
MYSLRYTTGLVFGILFLLTPLFSFAQSGPPTGGVNLGNPSGGVNREYSVQNPLRAKSISQFIEQILQAVLVIGIPVAILFIVLAGLKFVTAMGNSDKIKDARNNLLNTVIGIGLFLGAWTLAQVIYNTVTRLGGGI